MGANLGTVEATDEKSAIAEQTISRHASAARWEDRDLSRKKPHALEDDAGLKFSDGKNSARGTNAATESD